MNEYYSQKANPDPAIQKYKSQGSSTGINKALSVDKENNVLVKTGPDTDTALPFVSLSGAI